MAAATLANPSVAIGYAPFGKRLGAYLLDLSVIFALLLLSSLTLQSFRAHGMWAPSAATPAEIWHGLGAAAKLSVLLAYLLSTGLPYRAVFESSAWQATPGKRLFEIYVASDRGDRIGLARSLKRSFYKALFGPIHLIDFFLVLLGARHEAIHDHMAKTVVLSGRPRSEAGISPVSLLAGLVLQFLPILAIMFFALRSGA